MDGHKQRESLTAAERSLFLLERHEGAEAVEAAQRPAALDQVGAFTTPPEAVAAVAALLEASKPVTVEAWEQLARAVGPGPLAAHVAELRN